MKTRLLAFAFIFQCVFMHPALAAIDAAGAETLRADVDRALSWYADISAAARQGLTHQGTPTVTRKDSFYEVKIPHLQILGGNGFKMDVGTLVMNVVPGREAGMWKVSAALPKSMVILDAAGAVIADMTLGAQRFSAEWIPAKDAFASHDAEYSDIKITPRGSTPYSVEIKSFVSGLKMTRNADGTWSGPHLMKVEGLNARVAGRPNSVAFKAARMETGGRYESLPLEAAGAARDKVRALMKARKEKLGEDEIRRLTLDAARSLRIIPDGYVATMSGEGLALDYDPGQSFGKPAQQPIQIVLARFSGASKVLGLKQEKAGADLSLNIEGLNMTGVQAPLDGLIPQDVKLDLRAEQIPALQISEIFQTLISSAAAQSKDPAAAAKMRDLLLSVPAMLSSAGTSLTITDSFIRARDMTARLEGQLSAHAESPLKVKGKLAFSLSGLDEFLDRVKALAGSNPSMVAATAGMIPFQLMGRYEKGADGVSLRRYVMDIVPEGKVLMNGLDLAAPLEKAPLGTSGNPTPVGAKPVPTPTAP